VSVIVERICRKKRKIDTKKGNLKEEEIIRNRMRKRRIGRGYKK
jgi:hypothetical protein